MQYASHNHNLFGINAIRKTVNLIYYNYDFLTLCCLFWSSFSYLFTKYLNNIQHMEEEKQNFIVNKSLELALRTILFRATKCFTKLFLRIFLTAGSSLQFLQHSKISNCMLKSRPYIFRKLHHFRIFVRTTVTYTLVFL